MNSGFRWVIHTDVVWWEGNGFRLSEACRLWSSHELIFGFTHVFQNLSWRQSTSSFPYIYCPIFNTILFTTDRHLLHLLPLAHIFFCPSLNFLIFHAHDCGTLWDWAIHSFHPVCLTRLCFHGNVHNIVVYSVYLDQTGTQNSTGIQRSLTFVLLPQSTGIISMVTDHRSNLPLNKNHQRFPFPFLHVSKQENSLVTCSSCLYTAKNKSTREKNIIHIHLIWLRLLGPLWLHIKINKRAVIREAVIF